MFARITGPEDGVGPHSWVGLFPVPGGKFIDGGISGESAFEVNGRKVKPGLIVYMYAAGQETLFQAPLAKVG